MGPYFAAPGAGGLVNPLPRRDGVGTFLPIPQGDLGAAEAPWGTLGYGNGGDLGAEGLNPYLWGAWRKPSWTNPKYGSAGKQFVENPMGMTPDRQHCHFLPAFPPSIKC